MVQTRFVFSSESKAFGRTASAKPRSSCPRPPWLCASSPAEAVARRGCHPSSARFPVETCSPLRPNPAPVSARPAPAPLEVPCSGEAAAPAENGPRPPDPAAAGEGEALNYGKGSSLRWNGELTDQEDGWGFCHQSEGLSEPGNVGHPSRSQRRLCTRRPRAIFKDLPAYAVAVTFGIKHLKSAPCSRSSLSRLGWRLLTTLRTAQQTKIKTFTTDNSGTDYALL